MYAAFFFTMSPEDINELLTMPEEQATKHIRSELRYRGKQACAEHFGREFGYLIESGEITSHLRFTSDEQVNPALHEILSKAFGRIPTNGFYSLKSVTHIANDFSEMQEAWWRDEITWVLERRAEDLYYLEDLVSLMLQITEVFVYAKEHGHIVVTYWG